MRIHIISAALLALFLAACDSGSIELAGDELIAHTNAPTAFTLIPISGPANLGQQCSAGVSINDESLSETPGYFVIVSGPGTVGATSYTARDEYSATVTRGSSSSTIEVGFVRSDNQQQIGYGTIGGSALACE